MITSFTNPLNNYSFSQSLNKYNEFISNHLKHKAINIFSKEDGLYINCERCKEMIKFTDTSQDKKK